MDSPAASGGLHVQPSLYDIVLWHLLMPVKKQHPATSSSTKPSFHQLPPRHHQKISVVSPLILKRTLNLYRFVLILFFVFVLDLQDCNFFALLKVVPFQKLRFLLLPLLLFFAFFLLQSLHPQALAFHPLHSLFLANLYQ